MVLSPALPLQLSFMEIEKLPVEVKYGIICTKEFSYWLHQLVCALHPVACLYIYNN